MEAKVRHEEETHYEEDKKIAELEAKLERVETSSREQQDSSTSSKEVEVRLRKEVEEQRQ